MLSVTVDRFYRNMKKKLHPRRVVLCLAIALLLVVSSALLSEKCPEPEIESAPNEDDRLRYMLHGDNVDSGYLRHVTAVLQRLSFRRVNASTDFDLLWSHVYPFGESAPFPKPFFYDLKPYQKVNHFPGSGYFTNKVALATTQLKHVPRAFQLPGEKSEFLDHVASHPDQLFVQKSNSHRGIRVLKVENMNLDSTGTFVQEYIRNPFLVDGYKFDIGVYTVITSMDPLRVYIYNGDVLLRFCAKVYEPFDPEDVDRYVVGDDYTPIWEIPSLKKSYSSRKFGMRESLNIHMRRAGKTPAKIWTQIEESIVAVLLDKEPKIMKIMRRYRNVGNFFELVRFDFIVDENLNVYLMEANMSPNLSSEHFPPNRLLYENVLLGLFSLVGLGRGGRRNLRYAIDDQMEVPEKDLMVFGDECNGERCDNCAIPHCALCRHCFTPQNLRTVKHAYLEHLHKVNYKRIFPPKMNPKMKLENVDLENYSPENRFMMLWFLGKCYQDTSWC